MRFRVKFFHLLCFCVRGLEPVLALLRGAGQLARRAGAAGAAWAGERLARLAGLGWAAGAPWAGSLVLLGLARLARQAGAAGALLLPL